jgi:hypothetical protein
MTDYEFTIVATGLSLDDDNWQERFLDAGCDDALAAIQRGLFVLRFDREAASFVEAIESAIRDVEAAGAKVSRVEPDPLVSASDIAERSGLSRQLVSLYANGSRGNDFPCPTACATTAKPLWKWRHVARWLANNGKLDANAAEQAEVIDQVNDWIAGVGVEPASGEATVPSKPVNKASQYAGPEYYMELMAIRQKPAMPGRFRTDLSSVEAKGAEYLRSPESRSAACL